MAFNAKLDVNYAYVEADPVIVYLNAVFTDNTGLYYADSILPGFRVIQDISGWGFAQDILLYEVVENLGSEDGGYSYNLRLRWLLIGPAIELQTGYPTVIGEPNNVGMIDVPEANSQVIDAVAVNRIRNYLIRITTQVSSTYTAEVLDNTLKIPIAYSPNALKIYYNGLRLKQDVDYSIANNGLVSLNFQTVAEDVFVIEY